LPTSAQRGLELLEAQNESATLGDHEIADLSSDSARGRTRAFDFWLRIAVRLRP
jgi:hypothetical protein